MLAHHQGSEGSSLPDGKFVIFVRVSFFVACSILDFSIVVVFTELRFFIPDFFRSVLGQFALAGTGATDDGSD